MSKPQKRLKRRPNRRRGPSVALWRGQAQLKVQWSLTVRYFSMTTRGNKLHLLVKTKSAKVDPLKSLIIYHVQLQIMEVAPASGTDSCERGRSFCRRGPTPRMTLWSRRLSVRFKRVKSATIILLQATHLTIDWLLSDITIANAYPSQIPKCVNSRRSPHPFTLLPLSIPLITSFNISKHQHLLLYTLKH